MESRFKLEALLERRNVAIKAFTKDVLKEIAYSNPELGKFFAELDKYSGEIASETVKEHLERIDECQQMFQKNAVHTERIGRHLKKIGIELSLPYHYPLDRHNEYSNPEKNMFVEYHAFNGCRITREMLTNPNDQTFRNTYEQYKNRNRFSDTEIQSTMSEIKDKQRRLRFTILHSRKAELQEEIENAQRRLEILQKNKEEEEKAKQEMIAFDNLTPEQKREILRYLEASEAIAETRKLIASHEKKAAEARVSRYSEEIMLKSFERMKKEKGYTQEDISRFSDMIKTVKKKRDKKEYNLRISTKKDSEVLKYEEVIEGFLKYICEDRESIIGEDPFEER